MTEQQSQTNMPAKFRSVRLANVGVLFSILGVIVLFIAYYFMYIQFSSLYISTASATGVLQKNLEHIQISSHDYSQQIQQITTELNKQSQTIAELRQLQGQHPDQWRVSEAQYLVKLANDQLQLLQNISTAEKLLQAANEEVKNLPDPNLQSVQKTLAVDIARLQSAEQINVEEIYLRLMSLNEKLDQLPLIVQQVQKQPEESKQVLAQAPWWKKGLQQTWQTLQKIIVVKHAEKQIPLLTPEQREFLYLNLHARLETAVWGLVHRQPAVYQSSLAQMITWIKQYMAEEAALTQTVLTGLDSLQKINIQPPALSVNDSLQAFQGYFQSQKG